MRGEQSILIQAPIDAVYTYVSDFPRHIEWNHQPNKMTKLTDGPVGVGSRFRTEEGPPSDMNWFLVKVMFPIMSMIMGAKGYTEAEITELVPNQRIAWKAVAPGRGSDIMRANWEIDLSSADGGTQVTQRFHFMPQHPITKRMTNDKMAGDIGVEVARNLNNLKSILEK